MSIQILGTGAYVPERVLTNDELSTMVETSDEWITQRVGVKERRISTCESAAEMGAKAAQRALEAAGITADQLDLIVGATVSSDTGCPSMSALVQEQIGAHCPAFDVNSACSGFLFALDTAAAFIARGGVQYALVLGAERLSRILDWTDPRPASFSATAPVHSSSERAKIISARICIRRAATASFRSRSARAIPPSMKKRSNRLPSI